MMEDLRKSPPPSGISELEKIFQEYKSKLESAESDAEDIRETAWQKAESIIADKSDEAQAVADEIKRKAEQEAGQILSEAKAKAAEIEREISEKNAGAQNIADEIEQKAEQEASWILSEAKAKAAEMEREISERTRKEAKERTRKETERIITDTRQAAERQSAAIIDKAKKETGEIIQESREAARIQVMRESESIISEAREKAKSINDGAIAHAEEASHLIAEVSQKAEAIIAGVRSQVQTELSELAARIEKTRADFQIKSVLDSSEYKAGSDINGNGNGSFKKRRELNIVQPYDSQTIKKLVKDLKQIPGVKLDGEAGSEENYSIYLNISEPIPLYNIVREFSLVESSDIRGDTIILKLKCDSNGVEESF